MSERSHEVAAPMFSAVVLCYNRAALTRQALDSVLAQRFTDYEVVAVDDGSTDGTPELLRSYGERIRVVRRENGGESAARNTGIQVARGQYVAFLDCDDLWFPWTLAVFAAAIRQGERPAVVMGTLFMFDDRSAVAHVPEAALDVRGYGDFFASGRVDILWSFTSSAIRRDAFAITGPYAEERYNAMDLNQYLRAGALPIFAHIRAPATCAYRLHSGNAMANMRPNYDGLSFIAAEEKAGRFPGGAARKSDRRRIISHHMRSVACKCVDCGAQGWGWDLYRQAFWWHVRQGRARFLLGFPAYAAWRALRKQPRAVR